MTKRQGCDEFGLNFQTGKGGGPEIQTDFYVVILIELAANRLSLGDFAIRRDEKLPRYSRLELRSCLCELGLRHNPVVILVEFGKLCRVPDRERQRNLQTISPGADGEAAQTGIMRRRLLKW